MSRLMRKTAILAKIETTYATDAAPTGVANAILISNATFTFNYNNVDRDLMRAYLGGAEQLVGSRNVTASFDVEIAGSGAAGTAPAWGPLVRACGMAETITASARVEYNPVSATFDSLTIYYSVDGLLHKAIGCRGTMTMGMGEGERPLFKFTFTGIDGGTVAQADPTQTLTAFKPPLVVTDANSGDIKLGGTYATGAITGGTAYPSRGLQLDLGNTVQYIPMLGGQSVEITQRATTGSMQLDLTAAQGATFIADINSNTTTSLSFEHGTTAGNKVLVFAPVVQRINPSWQDFNGTVQLGMDLRLTPNTGNDELRIVVS